MMPRRRWRRRRLGCILMLPVIIILSPVLLVGWLLRGRRRGQAQNGD